MMTKNPAPIPIANSVSNMIDPPQRPRAGTLFRLDPGSFVAFRPGLPFKVAGTLPQGDDVGGPGLSTRERRVAGPRIAKRVPL